jgi:acyl-CoA thioesterase
MENPLIKIVDRIEKGERELINELNKFYMKNSPIHRFIGLEIVDIGKGYVKMIFRYRQELTRIGGMIHGGVIATVIDQAGGIASYTENEKSHQVTLELKINFLRPLHGENDPYTVEANVLRSGRRTIVTEVKIMDKDEKLAAIAIGTWYKINNI